MRALFFWAIPELSERTKDRVLFFWAIPEKKLEANAFRSFGNALAQTIDNNEMQPRSDFKVNVLLLPKRVQDFALPILRVIETLAV